MQLSIVQRPLAADARPSALAAMSLPRMAEALDTGTTMPADAVERSLYWLISGSIPRLAVTFRECSKRSHRQLGNRISSRSRTLRWWMYLFRQRNDFKASLRFLPARLARCSFARDVLTKSAIWSSAQPPWLTLKAWMPPERGFTTTKAVSSIDDFFILVLDRDNYFRAFGADPPKSDKPSVAAPGTDIAELCARVRCVVSEGGGWVEYRFMHPVTKLIIDKIGYALPSQDAQYAAMCGVNRCDGTQVSSDTGSAMRT